MLVIRIIAAEVFSRRVKSSKTGKEYLFRDQMAVVRIGGDTAPCKVSLSEEQAAYPVGEYELLESSFYVDRDQKIALGRMALRPVAAASGNAAASPAAVVAQRKLG